MKHIILMISIFSVQLNASEIDSFTPRYLELEDSTEQINSKTKELIQTAVDESNEKGSCNESYLKRKVWYAMWGHSGEFRTFLSVEGPLDIFREEVRDSVFRTLTTQESPVLVGLSDYSNQLGTIVKIGPYLIGSDKFEHFFGIGYGLYGLHKYAKLHLNPLLSLNDLSDRYIFGGTTTGIISFADKTANFAGIRFYDNLTGSNKDFITGKQKKKPIIECVDDRFVFHTNRFDWKNIIDASWDEAYNCSDFRRATMKDKINEQIQELERSTGKKHNCPLDASKLDKAKEHWGPLSKQLINSRGHGSIRN